MRRRDYISVLAVGALAGCNDVVPEEESSDDGTTDDEVTDDSGTSDDGSTDDGATDDSETPADDGTTDDGTGDDAPEEPSDESDPEQSGDDTGEDGTDDGGTDGTDDEPEEPELTEEEQRAAELISEGDAMLGEALDAYAASGAGETILDVRASNTQFRWASTAQQVSEANDAFDRAEPLANDDQRERIANLRNVGSFVRESVRVQRMLVTTFEACRDVLAAHQNDSINTVAWNRFGDRRVDAARRLGTLQELSQPDSATASEFLTVEQYRGKVDQFETELATFEQVGSVRQQFIDGHRAWLDAERVYRDRRWNRARDQFEVVTSEFGTAATNLDGAVIDDARLDVLYETYLRIARALADAAEEYAASASAYRDWEQGNNRQQSRETGDERRLAGRRILRDEDAVTDIPSVRRLENYTGP